MKQIYLLRHGHANGNPRDDKGRFLSEIGRAQVEQIAGIFLKNNLHPPTVVLSSAAKRTQETSEIFLEKLSLPKLIVEYKDELYLARETRILSTLESLKSDTPAVLYVGHNPGLEQLASTLTDSYIGMTTAALIHLEYDIEDWAELGSAQIVRWTHFEPVS